MLTTRINKDDALNENRKWDSFCPLLDDSNFYFPTVSTGKDEYTFHIHKWKIWSEERAKNIFFFIKYIAHFGKGKKVYRDSVQWGHFKWVFIQKQGLLKEYIFWMAIEIYME